mmetsp:Transcript_23961/g.49062  ORF Transcript_23961/g.49062 Transcript_23961/m.49062 type:complete len:710 (-) Transcript_23961:78-2207(-)
MSRNLAAIADGLWRISENKKADGLDGCVQAQWGNVGNFLSVYFPVMFTLVAVGIVLALRYQARGVRFILLICFLYPWMSAAFCPTIEYFVMSAFLVMILLGAALFHSTTGQHARKPGGWLSTLTQTRMASPGKNLWEKDWVLVGPLNEFAAMSPLEVAAGVGLTAWLVAVFAQRRSNALDLGDTALLAVGKGFSQVAIRTYVLATITGYRNTFTWHVLGVPYERVLVFHKMLGRASYVQMLGHVVCMATGGLKDSSMALNGEIGYTAWAGIVAFLLVTILVATSIPYVRRFKFEAFYFSHLNTIFPSFVFMVFHNFSNVAPFMGALLLNFYVDAVIRWWTKFNTKSTVLSMSLVCDVPGCQVVKMTMTRDGFPNTFMWEAGSYVWLAVTNASKGEDLGFGPNLGLGLSNAGPMGPPGGFSSMFWFHPMTISTAPRADGVFSVYVRAYGTEGEWATNLAAVAKKVDGGALALTQVKAYIGGPNGQLGLVPEHYHTVVLLSGGIGVTPMLAIANDLAQKSANGLAGAVKELVFLVSLRERGMVDFIAQELAAIPKQIGSEGVIFTLKAFLTGKGSPGNNKAAGPKIAPDITIEVELAAMMDAVGNTDTDAVEVTAVKTASNNGNTGVVASLVADPETAKGGGLQVVDWEVARPDFAAMLAQATANAPTACVLVCGPMGMMTDTTCTVDALNAARNKAKKLPIHLHKETFEF